MSDYHTRKRQTHLDGSPVFQNDADRAAEADVARMLAQAWTCEVHHFGALAPVDFYALRDGRIVGVIELKVRDHRSDRYPTTFLTVRKWLALTLASNGLGTPAIFVVRFSDCICWMPVDKIDASLVVMAGKTASRGAPDVPTIEVPVAQMRILEDNLTWRNQA